jgi:acetyl esterase/lipase
MGNSKKISYILGFMIVAINIGCSKVDSRQDSLTLESLSIKNERTPLTFKPPIDCDLSERRLRGQFKLSQKYPCLSIQYGSHSNQNYDLILPRQSVRDEATPLVVFIHGGGYVGGSKDLAYSERTSIEEFLKIGFAIASVEYRRINGGDEGLFYLLGMTGKYPPAMADSALALQDLRFRSQFYNIDPGKLALIGPSAGGGISLWLALHDDLRDPNHSNPIRRESTRVGCVATAGAQTSLHLREVETLFWSNETRKNPIPENIFNESFRLDGGLPGIYGYSSDMYSGPEDSRFDIFRQFNQQQTILDTLESSMIEASPISHLSEDDRDLKVLLSYNQPYGRDDIHSPVFGAYLSKGRPAIVKKQFSRLSFEDIGIDYTLRVNQGAIEATFPFSDRDFQNIFNFVSNRCF